MSKNEAKAAKVSRWFHIALMVAYIDYLGMFIAGLVMSGLERRDYFIAGTMMAVSALVGAVGIVLVSRRRKWSGFALSAVPAAASIVCLAKLDMLYDDFAPIVIFFVLPFLLTASVLPLVKKADEKSGGFAKYALLLTVAAYAQAGLFFLPWLKLPNDVHGYGVGEIMNLEDFLWRVSDAVLVPKIFMGLSLAAIALTVFFQLLEIKRLLSNRRIGWRLLNAASRCVLAECAGALCLFVSLWLCVFSGIYPTPWLAVILFSATCQLMLAKKIKTAGLPNL
ncbi:MAG: hypothetical protein LBJ64_02230 [Deltaproteobacteria bacterium]|jgi:hypothetical protein|nr:hypothetical protein [Deltaproteobacteria bacterium]